MKYIKNIFLFGLAFGATLIVLEVYILNAEIKSRYLNDFHEKIGKIRRPHSTYIKFKEGFGMGEINAYGYLGPDYAPDKKSGTIRIALLGDSYIQGTEVFDRHHFRALLEKNLEQKLNTDVEVLNFGMEGFNLMDMYAYDKLFVSRFHPDITLYFLGIMDIIPEPRDPLMPWVVLDDQNELVIDFPNDLDVIEKQKLRYHAMQLSSLVMMVRNCVNLSKEKDFVMDKLFEKLYIHQRNEADIKPENIRPDRVSEAILKELSKSGKIVIDRSMYHIDYIEKLDSVLDFDVSELFSENGTYSLQYHYWKGSGKYGHWNHQAHAVIASNLTPGLIKLLDQKFGQNGFNTIEPAGSTPN